jgi:hypothetical protein
MSVLVYLEVIASTGGLMVVGVLLMGLVVRPVTQHYFRVKAIALLFPAEREKKKDHNVVNNSRIGLVDIKDQTQSQETPTVSCLQSLTLLFSSCICFTHP